MNEDSKELVNYRLKEARETLSEARMLFDANKLRGAMNRAYYAMFYAAEALLATKHLNASKHSGVIAIFHREFVKPATFPMDLAKYLDIAFDLRVKSDYSDFVEIEQEKLIELVDKAQEFIDEIENIVKRLK